VTIHADERKDKAIEGAFRHRSGRVIALGRLVLAAVFLLAIWLDPSQPRREAGMAYGLLAGYVLWSAIMLGLTWRSWLRDYRLAGPAHVVDIAAFGLLVLFTEGYTSPFYTFFVFLLLSAAIRWTWRETAATAAAVLILFFIAGSSNMSLTAGDVDLQRLLVRLNYLVVLSLLIIWFGVNQRILVPGHRAQDSERRADADAPPADAAMRVASDWLGARRILLLWWNREEPWLNISEFSGEEVKNERAGPEAFGEPFSDEPGDRPYLFNVKRGVGLRRQAGRPAHERFRLSLDERLLRRIGANDGLAIRIRAEDVAGEMFALGIDGLCSDDLETAAALGPHIASMFDQATMVAVSGEAAVARAKAALARDLHDSVVQILAGASFRLEALKSWIKAGRDASAEIDVIKEEFAAEQRHVRAFIAGLRGGRGSTGATNLGASLPALAEQLARRWSLDIKLSCTPEKIESPVWMEHEVHQILREAAANAARHGKATALRFALKAADGALELGIADNGTGFPAPVGDAAAADGQMPPWSVHERVNGLGGTLSLYSDSGGSKLTIVLPLDRHS
jgi:signal transduction histidine kinase